MKKYRYVIWSIVIAVSLIIVGVASAVTIGNVDGVWGTIDTNGATCNRWATGTGGIATWDTVPGIQTPPDTDENQVRYGLSGYTCSGTSFANQSGFGFDGVNNVGDPAYKTPFFLGDFTHYNRPINASNPFDYVDLDVTLSGFICLGGETPAEGSDLTFPFVMDLDETPNSTPCTYSGTSICPDKVTIHDTSFSEKITCDDGVYTLNILGFTEKGLGTDKCWESYDSNAVRTYYITEENQENNACLWAEITDWEPTAVELSNFEAEGQIGAVLIEWTPVYETDNDGFNLYRSDSQVGAKTKINGDLIPSESSGQIGMTSYQYRDQGVQMGQTYYYWLESVSASGDASLFDPPDSAVPLYGVYLSLMRK